MSKATVRVETDPRGVATVWLARPEKKILDALLHCPPGALADTKAAVLKYAGLEQDAEALAELARPHGLKRLDNEAGEGLQSFLEKRKPAWYPAG